MVAYSPDMRCKTTLGTALEVTALQSAKTSRRAKVQKLLELQARIEGERALMAKSLEVVHSSLVKTAELYAEVVRDPQNVARRFPGITFPDCLAGPGGSQFGEDKHVFTKFFSKPAIKRDGVFFEMGGLDGISFSNSLFYEQCLGWSGVMVEGQPDNFFTLKKNRNREGTRRLWMAGCAEDGGMLSFPARGSAVSGDRSQMTEHFLDNFAGEHGNGSVLVPCGPLGKYINLAGVTRIDFFSLDVEGAEMLILESMDWSKIELHVLMVEMSGKRRDEIPPLLQSLGFVEDSEGFHEGSTLWYNASWVE
ncbi:hypothetical protein KFL_000030730 [Klebsormidium nitens]|uniref:Methyltransferase FkbM domain-containing protein n=1 Tax=Klebsormidium nitens TaxID=105231 RepID=A0A1Y1HMG6_KLENI|nr:hypothetical protein KFL_000030730 [Klebsormidium nitens]|eukprot:GAQ77796.1 hypothetical protein KFL_000030730 [Klebsormidium nitens]